MTRDELLGLGCGTQITDDALEHDYTPRRVAENGRDGDQRLVLWDCNGARAVQTNGDTVWEDVDPDRFKKLRPLCWLGC